MPVHVNNDTTLAIKTAQGDEHAFRELFDKYMPKILAFMRRSARDESLARELAQEVFVNIWTYRSALMNVEAVSPYIYRVAARVAGLYFKKQASLLLPDAAGLHIPAAENAATDMEAGELLLLIRNGIQMLPEKRREIFLLSKEQGLSRREIAGLMSISEHTVKNQLSAAVAFLAAFLNRHGVSFSLAYTVLKKYFEEQ